MKPRARWLLLFPVLLALGADCCDDHHDGYVENQKAVQACRDKGGIPTVEAITDQGDHKFIVLRQCSFPCDQRLASEK